MKFSRSVIVKAGAAVLALAAAGTASVAQARSNVYLSIGANVAPGVYVGASNAPVYYPQPVYVQPPVYYSPAPIYYEPAPVYVRPAPVYYGYAAAPVAVTYYYHGGKRYRHRHWNGHHYRYW